MTVPSQIFDYLILPIREADQREGKDFLKRYLLGPQGVWEDTDQKIKDIPDLWSVVDCPDEFLKFLKWIVGWTSELDSVTQDLVFDELRRLISVSGRLWKLRGPEDTIIDVLRFATGQRNRIWNWFDFRWLLPYVGPPDSVSWSDPLLTFGVNSVVGVTSRVGTPIHITSFETGQTREVQSSVESPFTVNLAVTDRMGVVAPSIPSTNVDDYQVRLVSPRGTELGEEHEGRDPWVVELPSPTDVGASHESNLRIVSDPAWDSAEEIRMRNLIVNLLKLMRASGERWEITYLGFLDQFIVDGDDTQWNTPLATFLTIAGGTMTLGDATEAADEIFCVLPSAVWSQAMYSARIRTEVPVPATSATALSFHWQDSSNSYALFVFPVGSTSGPAVWVVRAKGGTTVLATVDLSLSPIYPGVYYMYRVTIVDEGANKRIQVFIDGDEVANILDTDPIANGTVGFGTNFAAMEVDEVEVVSLPAESDYVDINS